MYFMILSCSSQWATAILPATWSRSLWPLLVIFLPLKKCENVLVIGSLKYSIIDYHYCKFSSIEHNQIKIMQQTGGPIEKLTP